MSTNPIHDLTHALRAFCDAREWGQFHTPKNLAMALSVEVAELVEHFQWLTPEEAAALRLDDAAREALTGEIADVAIYLLRIADVLGVDVESAVRTKLSQNEVRFPVEKMRGRATLPPDRGAAKPSDRRDG